MFQPRDLDWVGNIFGLGGEHETVETAALEAAGRNVGRSPQKKEQGPWWRVVDLNTGNVIEESNGKDQRQRRSA